MANKTLEEAKKAKTDEFYTQLRDIENELRHYKAQLKGKVILCNCDDPYESNFFKYFAMNFNHLELKKLIATSYCGSPIAGTQLSIFDKTGRELKPPYKIVITEVKDDNADGAVDLADVEYLLTNKEKNGKTLLKEGGDFRSAECIEILKEADVVVTNPPFSLFREYVAQLTEHNKQFIIIGSKNAITYKEIFSLIMNNKMWLGYGFANGNAFFKVPPDYIGYADGVYDAETGLVKFRNVSWFTNLDVTKRHEIIPLYKSYSTEEYPTYVNYNAIEVPKVADIPVNYDGEMGVPITFLDRYNPEQFEIIGSSWNVGNPISNYAKKGTYVAGGMRFYLPNGDGTFQRLYDRIVIKWKGAAQ